MVAVVRAQVLEAAVSGHDIAAVARAGGGLRMKTNHPLLVQFVDQDDEQGTHEHYSHKQ
jgi:hypothetical protein